MTQQDLYEEQKRLQPIYVNVKRVNAIFLDTYVFRGKYPVKTVYPRDNIDLPVGIYVDNSNNQLSPVSFDYFSDMPTTNFTSAGATGSPYISHGVLAEGVVNIHVVANAPLLRDRVFAEIMSAYMSKQGRCWFNNRSDITVHGYNLISSSELEFEPTLDGKVNILYTATLSIDFKYDIVTTRMLQYIDDIRDYVVVSFS